MKNQFNITPAAGLLALAVIAGLAGLAFYTGTKTCNQQAVTISPVWATATSQENGSLIATGSFAGTTEALYYLDTQSGRLSAAVLSRSVPGFNKLYTRNIKADLNEAFSQLKMAAPPVPQFLMVTGESDVRQVGVEMSKTTKAFVYVAEVNSGVVLVYALPNDGDRDLEIQGGEIYFWTFARLNSGTGGVTGSLPSGISTGVGNKVPSVPARRSGR